MVRIDEEEKQRQEDLKAGEGVADNDGFVTVMPRKRRPHDGDKPAAAPKKKARGPLQDFYHFQQHDRKREKLMQLRAQFEGDKQRIAALKAQRRFRPE
mmetsp:Transcript_22613/g.75973  ORF Transcript_22613/g.75973 Transcript_22613/m.75973 type:complete len:98 (+) Transcript_22613:1-294(+)